MAFHEVKPCKRMFHVKQQNALQAHFPLALESESRHKGITETHKETENENRTGSYDNA